MESAKPTKRASPAFRRVIVAVKMPKMDYLSMVVIEEVRIMVQVIHEKALILSV